MLDKLNQNLKSIFKKKENTKKGKLRENIEAIIIAILIALFIRAFFVQAFKIPSGSMLETLQIGDYLLVNKFIYGVKIPIINKTLIPVRDPKRGEVVVFEFPEDTSKDFIKRVVAIEGDKLQIINKKIYINDKLQDKKYYEYFKDPNIYNDSIRDNFGPIVIPKGHIFVLGDNRDFSYDSRFWGFVSLDKIKGKALILYWSWDSENFNVRWNRLFNLIK